MDLVRWGALGFMASGVMWVAAGVFGSFLIMAVTDFAVLVLEMVAFLLLILGMVGLHALQRKSYGIVGLVGFLTVVLGGLAQILGVVVFVVGSSSALLWLVSPVGPAVMVIGWVLYGAATLRARVLPRWCGVLFIVALPVALILQRPPKTLTPSQNASISVQIPDRRASHQNLYEEDHLRLPPSIGSIIVTTAVRNRMLENGN